MIKERKKITKYNIKKTKTQIIREYLRTVGVSFLVAFIITTFLTFHARNEMIKNLYIMPENQEAIDKKVAEQIILQSNLLEGLSTKSCSVCMHVGDLYQTIADYKNAEMAYRFAIEKAKPKNYKPYYKLICVLLEQDKIDDAEEILNNIIDHTELNLIKFKTRSNIVLGDKYYSIGKFLSAAKSYEKAEFYYNKLSKKDSTVENSIKNRIINSYIQVADVMVRSGYNSNAVRFLHKAEKYDKNNFKIRYKLAIVLSDLDPEKSVDYFEELLNEIPQDIDYGVYGTALMKAANVADLDGRPTDAKYYRYKIHSVDLFVNRKVVYKNDFETFVKSFKVRKNFFTYPLKPTFAFLNVSNLDIKTLKADFVLSHKDKVFETITKTVATSKEPLYSNGYEPKDISVKFNKKIFTKKELQYYTIKVYLYKDAKFKTLVSEIKIPRTSF